MSDQPIFHYDIPEEARDSFVEFGGRQLTIIAMGAKAANQFQAHPRNIHDHPQSQRRAVHGSLDKLGWIAPVLENIQTGNLLDGHDRVFDTLKISGHAAVLYFQVDITPAEEALAMAMLDNTAKMSIIRPDNLEHLLAEIAEAQIVPPDSDVDEFLAGLAEAEGVAWGDEIELEDPGADVDRAAELQKKWGVKDGDRWQLGDHRLICGDCTDAAVVKRVMGGEKAQMVFTSPPYNQGNTKGDLLSFRRKKAEKLYDSFDDKKTKKEYVDFLINCLVSAHSVVDSIHAVIWNVSYNANARDDYGKIVFSDRNPFRVFDTIVWDKKHALNIQHAGIYSRRCELVFVMADGPKYRTTHTEDGSTRWNYWEIDKGQQADDIGLRAAFPVAFAERGVVEFSFFGDIVYEPFAGSGTIIIACEKLGRNARAIEISPKYCAVILERWHQMTGETPVLID